VGNNKGNGLKEVMKLYRYSRVNHKYVLFICDIVDCIL
jgi:hypothetical protein